MKLLGLQKAHRIAARHREVVGKRPLFAKKAESKVGALYLYEQIGEDWWTGGGCTAKSVKEALAQLGSVDTLDIFINSEGGDIFEAKAIFAQLERFKAEKVVHIDGIAASAATFIAMVGDKIITAPHATWMIHEVRSLAFGRAEDMRAMGDLLDLENRTFAEVYAKRTGGDVDEILGWMNDETWMNAATAKERGFTDEVSEPDDEETESEQKAASASPRIVALEERTRSLTQHDVTAARQAHRLNELRGARPPEAPSRARARPTEPGQPGEQPPRAASR